MATTIKVSEDLRDRLNSRARAADLTVAELIEKLIETEEREARWEAIRQARARMTPAQWAEYDQEMQIWDRAADEDLAAYDPLP